MSRTSDLMRPASVSMGRVHFYVLRHILVPMSVLWLALVAQIWFIQLGELLEEVLPYAPPVVDYLGLSLLLLPPLMATILPVALIGGLLYGYYQLRARHELTVMLVSGASPLQLLRISLVLASTLSLIQAALLLWITPQAETSIIQRTALLQQNIPISGLSQAQVFLNPVPGLTLYAQGAQQGMMDGFMMSDKREPNLTTFWFAQRAHFVGRGHNKQLKLYNGSIHRTHHEPSGVASVEIIKFEEYLHDFSRFQKSDSSPLRKASARSIGELLYPPADDNYAQARRLEFRANAHNNLARSLHPLALTMLIGNIMLFGFLNRRSWLKRLSLAAIAGVAWLLLSFFLFSLASNLAYSWVLLYVLPIATIIAPILWGYRYK